MLEGVFRNSTAIYFGGSQFSSYVAEISLFGERLLVMSGCRSRFAGNITPRLCDALVRLGCRIVEVSDIGPEVDSRAIDDIVSLGRRHRVDGIVAVGGGTVIDAAKIVAMGLIDPSPLSAIFSRKAKPVAAAPVGVVLTLPGTGSESSGAAVYVESSSRRKLDIGSPVIRPRAAFIDPELSLFAPIANRAAGVVDAISHVLERYFTQTERVEISTAMCESVLRALVGCGVKLVVDESDIHNAANLAWGAKLAHDDTLGFGRQQDWATHRISHAVESVVPHRYVHGELLATLFPAWLDFVAEREARWLDKLNEANIFQGFEPMFHDSTCLATSGHPFTKRLRQFYRFLGMPERLELVGVIDARQVARAAAWEAVSGMSSGTLGNYLRLSVSDIEHIVLAAHAPHDG
jgi:alcohol dehydrogenase YqhD (iron-dependent ADH family)